MPNIDPPAAFKPAMDEAALARECASTDERPNTRRRLKALIAAHLLASTGLVFVYWIPDIHYLPLHWSLVSLSIAQAILLSFWTGMGNQRFTIRLSGAALGSVYLVGLPLLGGRFAPHAVEHSWTDLGIEFLSTLGVYGAFVLLLAAVFGAARRWLVELRLTSVAEQASQPEHYQFSIRRVLVITSIAAIVLALMRSESSEILFVVAFVINAVCASWAALAIGPARLRVGLVLCLAVSLGVAVAFEGIKSANQIIWWLSPAFAASLVLPSVIIIASLRVVRSCGYRLVALRNRKR